MYSLHWGLDFGDYGEAVNGFGTWTQIGRILRSFKGLDSMIYQSGFILLSYSTWVV